MAREKTLLLVEDNPDDEALTLRALRTHNITSDIVVARNGADALDYLFARGPFDGRDGADFPALVLLDLKLPKVDGIEVLRQIKADETTRQVPVVVFTSSREERDRVAVYQLGGNSYIVKPVDFEHFSEAVRHVGLYWLALNQQPFQGRRAGDGQGF